MYPYLMYPYLMYPGAEEPPPFLTLGSAMQPTFQPKDELRTPRQAGAREVRCSVPHANLEFSDQP